MKQRRKLGYSNQVNLRNIRIAVMGQDGVGKTGKLKHATYIWVLMWLSYTCFAKARFLTKLSTIFKIVFFFGYKWPKFEDYMESDFKMETRFEIYSLVAVAVVWVQILKFAFEVSCVKFNLNKLTLQFAMNRRSQFVNKKPGGTYGNLIFEVSCSMEPSSTHHYTQVQNQLSELCLFPLFVANQFSPWFLHEQTSHNI